MKKQTTENSIRFKKLESKRAWPGYITPLISLLLKLVVSFVTGVALFVLFTSGYLSISLLTIGASLLLWTCITIWIFKFRTKNIDPWSVGITPLAVIWVIRPILCSITAALIVFLMSSLDAELNVNVLNTTYSAILWLLVSAFIYTLGSDELIVPNNYGAVITLFGMKTNLWLSEGKYRWWNNSFIINRFKDNIPKMNKDYPESKDGFVWVSQQVIPIYHDTTENKEENKHNRTLTCSTRDSSTIDANLTVIAQVQHPRLWIESSDPLQEIADRTRSAFRNATALFIGRDCVNLKTEIKELMMGHILLACFLTKRAGQSVRFSVIQDKTGKYLHKLLTDEDFTASPEKDKGVYIKKQKEAFKKLVRKSIDLHEVKSEIIVSALQIEDQLISVFNGVGASLIRITVSLLLPSEYVVEQANEAAASVFEFEATKIKARAFKEAEKIISTPAEDKHGNVLERDELATMVAAAQGKDNPNVHVVYAPGSNSFENALIASAKIIGGRNDK